MEKVYLINSQISFRWFSANAMEWLQSKPSLCNTEVYNVSVGGLSQLGARALTHGVRVTHMCVSKLIIIGSDNGLSPSRRQAIIWTNAGTLLIRPSGTNFSEILIENDVFSIKKMHLKMSSTKCRPFCLGHNVLNGAVTANFQFRKCTGPAFQGFC